MYAEMYLTLFHAVTDALEALEAGRCEFARQLLADAQQRAEEIFIGWEEQTEDSK